MPGNDLFTPLADHACETADLERHGLVGEVTHDLRDPGGRENWVGVVICLADHLLRVPQWGTKYPGIIRLWDKAWAEFVPFLAFELEVRKVIFSTNAIESLNARFRRAVRARGNIPNEQAAIKCLYLALRSLDPTGRGRQRWAVRWKPALNAFALM